MATTTISSTTITVYHGTKHWSPSSDVLAKSVEYQMGRGASLEEALDYAQPQLVTLHDFSNRSVLERAMLLAQTSGNFSPFVSTSRRRSVARSFALSDDQPGFILTIEGPESAFYDFKKIRDDNAIPNPTEFNHLEEMGIPLRIAPPFTIVRVDNVRDIAEIKKRVYPSRRKRSRKR